MSSITEASFFDEHAAHVKSVLSQPPEGASALPDYLQPFVDFQTIVRSIPQRELYRFDRQLDELMTALNGASESGQSWPLAAYSFSQGYNEAYEHWLSALAPDAQAVEKAKVCERFRVEQTQLVKGALYFQILYPDPQDPHLVTPATWDEAGMEIAQRYNHRVPAKEHWTLPIAKVFAICNPAKPERYVHHDGGLLNYSGDEPTRSESNASPINRQNLNGDKPTTDPK